MSLASRKTVGWKLASRKTVGKLSRKTVGKLLHENLTVLDVRDNKVHLVSEVHGLLAGYNGYYDALDTELYAHHLGGSDLEKLLKVSHNHIILNFWNLFQHRL